MQEHTNTTGELPKGWREEPGETVFKLIRGVTYEKSVARSEAGNDLVPILRANNIQGGLIEADDLVYIPKAYVSTNQYLQPGDILIATSSGSRDVVGKTTIANSEYSAFAFGAFCSVARPNSTINPTWLFYYTRSRAYREYVEGVALGININNFRTRDLAAMPIPLPPLDEQRRIVAKLDALFAHTQRARAELARVPKLVERAKQAVLAKAFSGELTREWRELDLTASDWKQMQVGEVVRAIVAGKNLRCEERPPRDNERGVIKISAVTWGKFNPAAAKTLPVDFHPPEYTRIKAGDFLISRANTLELVGAVVVVDETPPNLFLSDKILRLELPEEYKKLSEKGGGQDKE